MYLIKEMPLDERPREKLLKLGVKHLSNVELLAILLRTGNNKKSVIDIAKDVLYKLESINELKNITINELVKIPGIKIAKASTIIAAIELGRRLEIAKSYKKMVKTSRDVYELMKHLVHEEQENFYCIFLNTRFEVIKKSLIYIGTVNQIPIHPREIFKEAVKANASFIILVHNHPTGNATPSKADKFVTKELMNASNIMNIEIVVHIIIGNNQYYSYVEDEIFVL